MNRLILFICILCTTIFAVGQTKLNDLRKEAVKHDFKLMHQKSIIEKINDNYIAAPGIHPKQNIKNLKSLDDLKKYYISSSYNVYGLLVPEQTALTYNKDINTIMFTHRSNLADPIIGNNIFNSISLDGGASWKHINVTGGDENQSNRYPSGVIYNPQGNIDYQEAYSVITGPTTSDNVAWTGFYYGSAKLDSSNVDVQHVNKTTYLQDMPRYGLTACDDGKIHVAGFSHYEHIGSNDTLVWSNAVMNNGSYNPNNNKFSWNRTEIYQNFYKTYGFYSISTAWSQDGSVGYLYFIGVDDAQTNNHTYQPIVFKSTDQGITWDKLPYFDFSTLTKITSNIWPLRSDPNTAIPYFSQNDGVVDSKGNLHLMSVINGRYSGNSDSIGYYFKFEPYKLFDVYLDDTTWKASYIDSIQTITVSADSSGYGSGSTAMGWDHRVQTCRNNDGSKLFFMWADSEQDSYNPGILSSNLFPNIKGCGFDYITGMRTPTKNFTLNTAYDGDNYFNYVSDLAITDGSKYRIPVTTAVKNASPDTPVDHYFLGGVYFDNSEFNIDIIYSGINEQSSLNSAQISQNYPNPFKNSTQISVYLPIASELALEIRDILGQKVYEILPYNASQGKNILSIKSSDLTSGIYFYTVSVNHNKVTKKMIVN